jgi:hypothetical protein
MEGKRAGALTNDLKIELLNIGKEGDFPEG